jgi:hypothetical protein
LSSVGRWRTAVRLGHRRGVDGDCDRVEGGGDVVRQQWEYSHSLNGKRALHVLRNIVTCGLRLFEIIHLLLQIGNWNRTSAAIIL